MVASERALCRWWLCFGHLYSVNEWVSSEIFYTDPLPQHDDVTCGDVIYLTSVTPVRAITSAALAGLIPPPARMAMRARAWAVSWAILAAPAMAF